VVEGQGHSVTYRRQNVVNDQYNLAAHCFILLKFGTEFDHMTPYLLQTFKVQRTRL